MVKSKTNDLLKAILLGLGLGVVLIYLLGSTGLITPNTGNNQVDGGSNISFCPAISLELILEASEANVSDDQLLLTVNILKSRFGEYDNTSEMLPMRDEPGDAIILIYNSNLSVKDPVSLATTQGMFELRMQAAGNASLHVVYGDDVRNVSAPVRQTLANGSITWGVQFGLTDAGIRKFREACNESGAAEDLNGHSFMMLLDGNVIYTCPVSDALAGNVTTDPATLYIMTGTGDAGKTRAQNVGIFLKYGPLPVKAELRNT